MTVEHFIVATAGHVDHGKSALVKALTGIDPDRLPEEKARGITIDLGFAHLELPAPPLPPAADRPPPAAFHLGLVDVPGHEDFVKNMVAGVGSIDLALLVVAADDGWMPQTEEHLQILTYLGVTRAVVALTKIDLAEGRESEVAAAVRRQLAASPFAEAPMVATSVVAGRGLTELKASLADVLARTPPPRDIGKPRLPFDRVFTLKGIGTVATGTLSGGSFRRGQTAVIQPAGRATRIRSAQSHNRDVELAPPGTRTAVNLPDVAIGDKGGESAAAVHRGEVITLPELGGACDTLDVLLEKSPRLVHGASPAARPLKDGAVVRVHHGSANTPGRVLLRGTAALLPGQRALARLRLDAPVFLFAGDRFIVRDWSEQATLAGGIVLDPEAAPHPFRDEKQRAMLDQCAMAPDDARVLAAARLARDRAVSRPAFLLKSRFSADEVASAVAQLVREERAVGAGDWLLDRGWWTQLQRRAAELVEAGHRAHPERVGLPLGELRRELEAELPAPELFNLLVAHLGGNGFTQVGTVLRAAGHRPALPPALQAAGARLRAALGAKPFEPPTRKELAPDAVGQQALRFLLETGEAVEVGAETVLLAEHYASAVQRIQQHLRQRGAASASELRQLLGTNRRVIIPLLERLDREGVTLRQGDQRVLKTR